MSILISLLFLALAFALIYFLISNWQQWLVRRVVIQSILSFILLFGGLGAIRFWTFQSVSCLPNCVSANLMGRDLSGLDLRQANFTEANLRNTNLSDVDLFNAYLTGASLRGANLRNANLRGANLIGADLSDADLRGAILNTADLRGANLTRADLTRIDLRTTQLKGTILDSAKLIETDLRSTDLSGISFLGAILNGANLSRASLLGAKLSNADLSGANFFQSDLKGAWLNVANLTGADLSEAELEGISGIGATLASANFSKSDLTGASLIGADLSGANLQSVHLDGTRLFVSEFNPQDLLLDPILMELNEIRLAELKVDANLNGVRFNQETMWPAGKRVLLANVLGDEVVDSQPDTASGSESILLNESSELPDETTIIESNIITGETFLEDAPLSEFGEVVIVGSSTVAPLTQEIYNLFIREEFTSTLTLDAIGSSDGIDSFCQTDGPHIVMSSRPIQEDELAACAEVGRAPIEFQIGIEALAVVVNSGHDVFDDALLVDIASIFSHERWIDVNPSWPDEEIRRFIPERGSGHFDFFVESIFGGDEKPLLDAPKIVGSSDDAQLAQAVAMEPQAIGFLGYKHYLQNQAVLKLISVEGVELSPESVKDGEYPLAHTLFLYSDVSVLQQNVKAAEFLKFYLSTVSSVIEDVGYFPIDQEILDSALVLLSEIVSDEMMEAAREIERETPEPIQDEPEATETPTLDFSGIEGNFVTAGSSTITPLTQDIYGRFIKNGFSGQMELDNVGSSAGFKLFCESGVSDIVMASRPIRDDEIEACNLIRRSPIEFRIGTDAIAVVVNAGNKFVEDVSLKELQQIFTAEKWLEVNVDWPADSIVHYLPDEESGTFDFFVETVFDENSDILKSSTNTAFSTDDTQLAEGVARNPSAVGFFGYAYYLRNISILNALSIEGVLPSMEAVEDGDYLLSRPLYLYSDMSVIREKPQVAAFLYFYLTSVNEIIEDVGYFPASEEVISQSIQTLESAITVDSNVDVTLPTSTTLPITVTAEITPTFEQEMSATDAVTTSDVITTTPSITKTSRITISPISVPNTTTLPIVVGTEITVVSTPVSSEYSEYK